MTEIVNAASFQGMSYSWNLNLLNGPKFTIRCGKCSYTWRERIPMIDYPTLKCHECGVLNRLNLVVN